MVGASLQAAATRLRPQFFAYGRWAISQRIDFPVSLWYNEFTLNFLCWPLVGWLTRILVQAGLLTRGKAFTDAQVLLASKAVSGERGFTDTAFAVGVHAFVGGTGSPSDRKAAFIGIEPPRALMRGPPVAKALHQVRVVVNRDDAE